MLANVPYVWQGIGSRYFCCLLVHHIHSGQFPELHARICKTYIDALAEDKSLATVYGAIVGLCAMGNSIVRTVLLLQLGAIQSRLQAAEADCGVSTAVPGAQSQVLAELPAGAGVAVSGQRVKQEPGAAQVPSSSDNGSSSSGKGDGKAGAGKRKRGASLDGAAEMTAAGDFTTSNTAITSTATTSATAQGRPKFSKASAVKLMQQQVAVGMCREALLRALGEKPRVNRIIFSCVHGIKYMLLTVPQLAKLNMKSVPIALYILPGKYIAYSVRLPDLGQGIGFGSRNGAGKSVPRQR